LHSRLCATRSCKQQKKIRRTGCSRDTRGRSTTLSLYFHCNNNPRTMGARSTPAQVVLPTHPSRGRDRQLRCLLSSCSGASQHTRAHVLPPPRPRCDAFRSIRAPRSSSSFDKRVRAFALAVRSRLRAPHDDDSSTPFSHSPFSSRGALLRPGFCMLASPTRSTGGRAP
jgi:hypothetical protein